MEVPVKNYTASTLAAALKEAFDKASPNGYTYTIDYSSVNGKLSITTPADKEYDWAGTWTLETQPFVALAGHWNVYDGVTVDAEGNPVAIRSELIQRVTISTTKSTPIFKTARANGPLMWQTTIFRPSSSS